MLMRASAVVRLVVAPVAVVVPVVARSVTRRRSGESNLKTEVMSEDLR
jgi:hypothetical protein